jgi:selenocysteine lyase/cysteine desulfurase
MTVESPTSAAHPHGATPEAPSPIPGVQARRRFLQIIGASAAGVTTMGSARASTLSTSNSTGYWNAVENSFTLNQQKLFMNIGTAGSMPRQVLDFFDAANREYARESLSGYSNFLTLRQRIAPGFGVDPDELVVSYNTSDGMCHAILGIPWRPGDCVITTNQEHPGGNVPLQIAVDRYGVVVRRVILPVGNNQTAAAYAALFQQAIDAARTQGLNVRAMMWSSPTFLTGTMLPIRRLVDVAIANGLISICDGAHLPGMMAYDYAKLGVDFMAGAGHKWQCGPGSTGILVIRNKVRAQYNPLPLPPYFPVVTSSYAPTIGGVPWSQRATGPVETYNIGNVIQSCGSKHTPLINSLGAACDMWDQIGRQTIQDYILGLSSYLKDSIVARFGGTGALYAPKDDPELLSALTSFSPFYYNPSLITQSAASNTFVSRLSNEYGIVVRNTTVPVPNAGGGTTNHYPLRVSTHLWHDRRDVDRLVEACLDLAGKMSRGM